MTVAHWDDVAPLRAELAPMAGTWRDLGWAAGSVTIGVRRIEVDPGAQSTPVHRHGAEDECVFVLASDGGLLWQDGATHELRAGDMVAHPAGGPSHTLIGPLDVLVFGTRERVELGHLPRAGAGWLGAHAWVDVHDPAVEHPWAREAEAGPVDRPPPTPRPENVVNVADEMHAPSPGRVRLQHVVLDAEQAGVPPHCHSAEEELFVVLEGDGVAQVGVDEHALRRGSVVSRPAGTGVAHQLRADERGLTYLVFGTVAPDDMVLYPERGEVRLKGLGVTVKVVDE